jgi:RNA polymerase sigma factor (sigma-70 family)
MGRSLNAVVHWIRQVTPEGGYRVVPDKHLLERFLTHKDAEAFTELMQRHGPMVWAVCRRALTDVHDAEDAFQATFLLLVRKAASITKQASVGSWLHGVAYRVATKARSHRLARSRCEREITDMAAARASSETLWHEVQAVLDEEVDRLPQKYQAPFVLCYLEGKTNDEAAQHLRCPKGTVATRLAWARRRLRKRLVGRGITLSIGLFATLLSEKATPAAVPGTLVRATLHAALCSAAGAIPAQLAALMESGMQTLSLSKAKMFLAVGLAATAIGMGAAVLAYQRVGTGPSRGNVEKSSEPPRSAKQQPATEKNTITGTVVDAEGRPLPDVEVRTYRNGTHPEPPLRSDAHGQIHVPRAWDNRDNGYTLIAEVGTHLGWYALPDWSGTNQGKPVQSFQLRVLPRTKTIQGTLLNSTGRPLVKAVVTVQNLDGARWEALTGKDPLGETVTDNQRHFAVRVPDFTQCELVPVDQRVIRKRMIAKPTQPDLGRITVAEAGSITGRVTHAQTGRRVVGATVFAQFLSFPDTESGGYGETQTDANGRYRLGSLRPGLYNVLFEKTSEQSKITAAAREAIRVEVGKAASVDFQAAEGRLLAGKVVGNEDGKPIPDLHVGYYGSARPRSGAACMMVRTDPRGTFRFYVPPGTAYLYVAESRGPVITDSSRTLEVPADRDPEEVQLVSYSNPRKEMGVMIISTTNVKEDLSYHLPLRLRSKNGKPVVGANVWLWRKGATTWSLESAELGEERNLSLLGPSSEGQTYLLIIEADGWARPKPPEIVAAKVMKPLVVEMEPATYIPVRGRVLDRDGKPVAGALVRAGLVLSGESTRFPWDIEPTTDVDGRFELKRFRPGDKFNLQIGKKDYDTLTSRFFVVGSGEGFDL